MRAVGCALLFAASTLAGLERARRLSRRTRQLRQAVELVEAVGAEIRYAARELPAVCAAVAARQEGRRPDTFLRSADAFSPDDRQLFAAFLQNLGDSDLAGQLAHCAHYAALLREQAERARQTETQCARLYASLGVFGGLALVIFWI